MKSSIFIPKTINVGFQTRSDTYTKKLAYVIYYDEKGKLRKETSWNSWRDQKIPNEEFENTPISGFVLNKKVGDYDSGWNHRMAYCRIYDPRNFEFEITIENLLYILENTNSIKGKGLEGEFVYGWDGKDLILIPCDSPDYKQMQEYNEIIHNKETIKAKDLIVGATYIDKENTNYVYIGRFDKWDELYSYYNNSPYSRHPIGWDKKVDDTWVKEGNRAFKWTNKGKHHWFAYKSKYCGDDEKWCFVQHKTITNKFVKCIDDKCHNDYSMIFDKMEFSSHYSPYDISKDKYIPIELDELKDMFKDCSSRKFTTNDGVVCEVSKVWDEENKRRLDSLFTCYSNPNNGNWYDKPVAGFEYEEEKTRSAWGVNTSYKAVPTSLEKIHEVIKPVIREKYLANGNLYSKQIH